MVGKTGLSNGDADGFCYKWPHIFHRDTNLYLIYRASHNSYGQLAISDWFATGDDEEGKEVGWKYIHGDVFRYPQNTSLFCAVMGERSVLLAGIMHAGPLFVIGFILNVIAVSYEAAAAALPFSSMLVIILIYTFLAIPLLVLGGVIGYLFRSEFKSPCATKRYLREIPPLAWMLTLPSILFIMFIILILLTAILSVGLTYIQLSVEDHQWWWRSVLCGGSTSIFMFDYCIYFYARSSMSGLLQFSFVVGYNACMCYAFFLMLGTVGFRSSLIFVRYIYELLRVNDSASSCSR
ncbi:hypothetical protein V6N13_010766 [Hibiscus sabdariffa]